MQLSPVDRLALRRPELLRCEAYIDGRWIAAAETLSVFNPATGEPLSHVPALTDADARAAITAASKALPAWTAMTAKARGDVLRRWFELIMHHQEDLSRLLTAEQGKPLAEARGEIAYAASFLEWFSEEGRRAYGEIIPPHQSDRQLLVTREAVGVVAAITPWNFPSAMITRKVAPALAAGCTLVLKPSELTPLSALALAVLAEEAGVPPGVFNILTGRPSEIGPALTDDPRIAKFTFTGSTAVGKLLAARCMGTVKRVSLELGGNAPFIVFDDADLNAAVDGAMLSKFRNTGQTCVCANRILVQRGIYKAFAQRFTQKAEGLIVGDGLTGQTDTGPLINEAAVAKVSRHIKALLAEGARLETGGGLHALGGTFFQPTVMTDVSPGSILNREETFGPLAGLVPFSDEADAISIANDTRSGLAAYAYTQDLARAGRICSALAYGMIGINTGAISTEVAPFGGIKESGFGREGSRHGLDEFLNVKLSVIGN